MAAVGEAKLSEDVLGTRTSLGRTVPYRTVPASAVPWQVDGAYTEGTGVATAVAAGASEVVVLLNSIRSTSAAVEADSLVRLFRGAPPPPTQTDAPYLTQVFEAPLAPALLRRLQAFRRLRIPAGSQYLSELALGTVTARTYP